jgi:ribosomal protein S14
MPRTDHFDKFRRGGVITCLVCGRKTRETGKDETNLEMCRFCIRENEWLNSFSDGEITEEEYNEELAKITLEREAADG